MRRLIVFCVAGLFVLALARAQAAEASHQTDTKKIQTASGTVSAVTDNSLTVKGKTAEWTFVIDKDTRVTGTGAGTKREALKDDKKPSVLTEYVKPGDNITVRYRDLGETKEATEVRVTLKKPAK
jgi:hypothetical protein